VAEKVRGEKEGDPPLRLAINRGDDGPEDATQRGVFEDESERSAGQYYREKIDDAQQKVTRLEIHAITSQA
jgi:hypothetical protein